MKGLAMLKIGEIGWIEKERPTCGPSDAILRPLALAPCTSDVHTIWEGTIGERHNLIMGHEALGIVDEVGSGVRDFKPGDRVIVPACTPDWDSEAAQRGFPSQSGGLAGGWKYSNTKDGSFAEYFHIHMADGNLAHLPDWMSLESGIMLPDMLTTGFMGAENANIQIGSTVAVLGIGPVGLCAIAAARMRGAGRIFAVGTRPVPAKVAKTYGANDLISYKDGDTAEQILEATGGAGVDAVVVAGGGPDILIDAFNMAKPGSVVSNCMVFGATAPIPLSPAGWGLGVGSKDLRTGICPGGRVRMERLCEAVKYCGMDPALMATQVFKGLDRIEEALLLMKSHKPEVIKPVVICE
ncbi:MAG: NAD(P)-dependent alcohol dehydrogenase [Methanospirillum sp.]